MIVGSFWTAVARPGGSLARSHDAPSGWRTIWRGWRDLQTLREDVPFAFHLRLSHVGKNQIVRPGGTPTATESGVKRSTNRVRPQRLLTF